MTNQPRFCVNCGAALQPGAQFCASCGRPTAVVSTPPPTVPPAVPPYQAAPPQVVYQSPPAQVYAQPSAKSHPARPRVRLRFGSILLLAVGLILVLLLLVRFAALKVVGVTTVGTVTAVEATGGEDYEYRVSYSFVVDGSTVTGAAVLGDVLNISTLPAVGEEVTVRYLPFWSAINEMEK